MHTIKDAAQALGIHPKTLRRWEEKGKFIPSRTLGNQRRFSDKDLNLLAKVKAGEPIPPAAPKILTLEQTAAKLHVSPATVQRWTKEGKLKIRVSDQLQPGYYAADLQGPTLQLPTGSVLVGNPTRTDPMGKYLKYSGLAALALTLIVIAYLWIKPKPIASPAVLETQTPVVDVALPRTAQFFDGRITLGLATGDLFYADSLGNIYAKNSALIDQGVFTRLLQLLPGQPPQESQIGQLYVDQGSGNLKYFDGLDWIDLNQNASQSAINNQFPYDITLGDLNASASARLPDGQAESLRITLAGDQSIFKVLGGAGQDLLTLNDDALYPVIISQPTQILGNLLAPQFIDQDQTGYFLDPSSTTVSLAVAGDATISSTLKFSQYGEYLTNSVDDYLIFSGGIGIGGVTSYGFSTDQKLNARAAHIENDLTVTGNTGMGTDPNSSYRLKISGDVYVSGDIRAAGHLGLPDYVFEPDYSLLSPLQLREFITTQKHLPGVPSAAEIQQNGLSIKQLLLAILEKTEENTLYILDLYDKSNRIISPTVETEILTTSMISPLTDGQITISGNASVSGTLFAQEIKSSTIDRLREKISELAKNLTSEVATVPAQLTSEVTTASAQLTSEVKEVPTSEVNISLASLEADIAFFKDFLAVLGQTTLTDLTVNGNLTAGLILAQRIEISGDLLVAGAITAKEINPLPDQKLSINIAGGSAVSIYADTVPVATFSAEATSLNRLDLANSGTATIAAGTNAAIITAEKFSDKSQIVVTFTSDSKPATKYWVKKEPELNQFTIFTNYPVNSDTTLDWLMIN